MTSARAVDECIMDERATVLAAVEQCGASAQLRVPSAATDKETLTGNVEIGGASVCESGGKKEGVSTPPGTIAYVEGPTSVDIAKISTVSENWRDRHDRRCVSRVDQHRNSFQPKEIVRKLDQRRAGCAPLPQHEEVEKTFLRGIKCKEGEPVKPESAATALCYVKMLISNQLAGMIIGNTGQEVKRLKEVTGAKIVLSPHGTYFPGTSERLVSAEGTERSVFQVIDWIIDRMHDLAKSKAAGTEEKKIPLKVPGKSRSEAGSADAPAPGATTATTVSVMSSSNVSPSQCSTPLTCKLCVPRAVVGSLIGRKGGYIQSVRVATEANINISPLFVTADEACAERIITIESSRLQSLRTATFTLARKINSHPEKATCKHMCYYRRLSFEPSPLALIEESRRDRMACRFVATDVRTTTAESQPQLVPAENESPLGSAGTLARIVSFPHRKSPCSSQHREPAGREKSMNELMTSRTAGLLYHHSGPPDDAPTERDVSCFSSASTATSATKISLPFEPLLCHSSLSKIGGATRTTPDKFSSTGPAATISATERSIGASNTPVQLSRDNLPIPLSAGFLNRHTQCDVTRVTESVGYAQPATSTGGPCSRGVWWDQVNRQGEPRSHQDGIQVQQHNATSEKMIGEHLHAVHCVAAPHADNKLTAPIDCYADCKEATEATGEGRRCRWSTNNTGMDCSRTSGAQLSQDLIRYSGNVNVPSQLLQTTSKVVEMNKTPCHQEIYALGHMIPDEAQYAPCAFSHESLTPICSTAAGSIATLTNILQGIQEDVPDQQAGRSRGVAAISKAHGPQFAKTASQEANGVAFQLCKNCQYEQRGTSLPDGLPRTDRLQSFPRFDIKNITSKTEVAAAAAQFASVTQSSDPTASAVATIPPVANKERTVTGLDPTAAEFFPSRFTLHCPYQKIPTGGDLDNAPAIPSDREVGKLSEDSASEQTQVDRLQNGGDLEPGGAAREVVKTTAKQPIDKGLPARTTALSLSMETGDDVQRSSAEIDFSAKIASEVTSITEKEDRSSEPASVVKLSSTARPTEQLRKTPLSTRHSSVEEQKMLAEGGQRGCDAAGTKCTTEEQATEKGEMPSTRLLSTCGSRLASLDVLSTLTNWIPRLLDCSFAGFMMLWTTALVAGLLLSFLVTQLGSS